MAPSRRRRWQSGQNGPALEPLGAPDVVAQDVDSAVIVADALGRPPDLRGVEMAGADGDAGAGGRPGDDGDTSAHCIVIECPAHPMSVAEQRVHTPDRTAVADQPCWPGA